MKEIKEIRNIWRIFLGLGQRGVHDLNINHQKFKWVLIKPREIQVKRFSQNFSSPLSQENRLVKFRVLHSCCSKLSASLAHFGYEFICYEEDVEGVGCKIRMGKTGASIKYAEQTRDNLELSFFIRRSTCSLVGKPVVATSGLRRAVGFTRCQ